MTDYICAPEFMAVAPCGCGDPDCTNVRVEFELENGVTGTFIIGFELAASMGAKLLALARKGTS